MAGTCEKCNQQKWYDSLSSVFTPHLPGYPTRVMAPANGESILPPIFTVSGSTQPGSEVTLVKISPDEAPKSPTFSLMSFDGPVCRICHDIKDELGNKKLISPCGCTGSAQFIHKQCLQKWTKLKGSTVCEICNKPYEKKYVKFKMTSTEENTLASAITILLLLLGVLSVGLYLLAEYLVKVRNGKHGSNEIWVSISLVITGSVGMILFLPWFICFCTRTGRTPRTTMMTRQARDLTSTPESSTVDLSIDVENALQAMDQSSETGAYVNQTLRDNEEVDNDIYASNDPAVLPL